MDSLVFVSNGCYTINKDLSNIKLLMKDIVEWNDLNNNTKTYDCKSIHDFCQWLKYVLCLEKIQIVDADNVYHVYYSY
jgi:hypothetical protein